MYPYFQYISFHEQSDRVSFLEGKVFQYGWIFLPFSIFTENWKVFITSILMKTAKDLEIIRGDIHIRICKHPYHTSVDVCLFVCFCCFTSHVNSYGHCGTVSSLNHTFSWAGLSKRLTSNLCTYFRL